MTRVFANGAGFFSVAVSVLVAAGCVGTVS
ncbi:MAG: hypothetical protein JWM82_2464, partial [Myxococcales bacterium]|nr:hypothetical protein [Myxococcales bacterium]